MKKESKHTPAPWSKRSVHFAKKHWEDLRHPIEMACVVHGQDVVAITYDTDDDDNPNQKDQFNAAHIVKCVNMHDELVQMLKDFRSEICGCEPGGGAGDTEPGHICGACRLLAKAEVK